MAKFNTLERVGSLVEVVHCLHSVVNELSDILEIRHFLWLIFKYWLPAFDVEGIRLLDWLNRHYYRNRFGLTFIRIQIIFRTQKNAIGLKNFSLFLIKKFASFLDILKIFKKRGGFFLDSKHFLLHEFRVMFNSVHQIMGADNYIWILQLFVCFFVIFKSTVCLACKIRL